MLGKIINFLQIAKCVLQSQVSLPQSLSRIINSFFKLKKGIGKFQGIPTLTLLFFTDLIKNGLT